jgi:hypothetical protein
MCRDCSKLLDKMMYHVTKHKPQLWFWNWTAIKTPNIPFPAMTEKKVCYVRCQIKNTVDRFIMEVSWNMHVLHKDRNISQHLNVLLMWQLCDSMNHKWLQKWELDMWEIHNQTAWCPLTPPLVKIVFGSSASNKQNSLSVHHTCSLWLSFFSRKPWQVQEFLKARYLMTRAIAVIV